MMKQQNMTTRPTVSTGRTEQTSKKLTLMDFAEVFLTLPETSKHEVLGYAKCLYASEGTTGSRPQIAK